MDSTDWRERRAVILERDSETCQFCGRQDDSLDVHHIQPRSQFTSERKANHHTNLVTLCKSCHKKLEYYDPSAQERKLWREGFRPLEQAREVEALRAQLDETTN